MGDSRGTVESLVLAQHPQSPTVTASGVAAAGASWLAQQEGGGASTLAGGPKLQPGHSQVSNGIAMVVPAKKQRAAKRPLMRENKLGLKLFILPSIYLGRRRPTTIQTQFIA